MERPSDLRVLLGALVAALVVLTASGALMLGRASGDPETAHAASAAMPLTVRSVHSWAASIAIAVALVAAAHAFVMGCYPRATVLATLGGLGLLMAAYESGAILPWDQRAWEAWRHVRAGAGLFGVAPGAEGDPSTVPLAMVLGTHAALGVLLASLASWVAWTAYHQEAPHWRAPLVTFLLVPVAVLLAASLWPVTLGPAPVRDLVVSRPHWPFLWVAALQTWWGSKALMALPAVFLGGALFAIRPPSSVAVRRAIVLLVAVLLGVLTYLGGRP